MPKKISLNIERDKLLYLEQGFSLEDISNLYGCSRQTIASAFRRKNIPIKCKNGEVQNAFVVDNLFFKKWSWQMAYILGYICADGCIRPHKYETKVKSIDYELLHFMQSVMKTNYPIKIEKNTRCYSLSIYSKEIIKDLLCLGVTPKKSLILEFPNVPDKYLWSFLRGVTDGDGHIRPPHHGSKHISWAVNGSKPFLTKMLSILSQKIGSPNYALNPQGKSFAVAINGEYAYNALNLMYSGTEYGLSRKKNVALLSIKIFCQKNKCISCNIDFEGGNIRGKYCHECKKERQRAANRKSYATRRPDQ